MSHVCTLFITVPLTAVFCKLLDHPYVDFEYLKFGDPSPNRPVAKFSVYIRYLSLVVYVLHLNSVCAVSLIPRPRFFCNKTGGGKRRCS